MKKLVFIASLLFCTFSQAAIYDCEADLAQGGKGAFTLDTDTQDKASVEIAGGTEIGCAASKAINMLTCYVGSPRISTLSAVADLGTSVIGLGVSTSKGLTKLECHKR